MSIKVNLIKNRHTLSEAEYLRETRYFRYAIIAIVLLVFVTTSLAIWQLVVTQQLKSVERKISESTKQLQGLAEANAKQIYLKSRLKLITTFLDDRSISRQSIQKVFSLDIPGVTISSANFEEDNVLHIQATADNVQVLKNLVTYFSSDDGFFIQVVSKGLTRSNSGEYQMDLLLTLPKT